MLYIDDGGTMVVRRLFGIDVSGTHSSWIEVATAAGWCIQYNSAFEVASSLQPYRLLDPDGRLWASSDNALEMSNTLQSLFEELAGRTPLLNDENDRANLVRSLQEELKTATPTG